MRLDRILGLAEESLLYVSGVAGPDRSRCGDARKPKIASPSTGAVLGLGDVVVPAIVYSAFFVEGRLEGDTIASMGTGN